MLASLEQHRDQTACVPGGHRAVVVATASRVVPSREPMHLNPMLSDGSEFPSLGGSRHLRSEFWHCELLTYCSLMGLGRFNSIDCAVY